MKERPILFSAPMVRAILAGTKTQTRLIVKPQPTKIDPKKDAGFLGPVMEGDWAWPYRGGGVRISSKPNGPDDWADECPYGRIGDRLWVKETFAKDASIGGFRYYATDDVHPLRKKRPPIHMPRIASRITLEITGVRVELLNDISESDAMAEGVETHAQHYGIAEEKLHGLTPWYRYDGEPCSATSARGSFQSLWKSIHGDGAWELNPWVWCVSFRSI